MLSAGRWGLQEMGALAASVLIVGLGYLGRVAAARWQECGSQVYATTRSAERAEALRGRGISPVRWDVLTGGDELPAVDIVLYCVGFDRQQAASMREVYVGGLQRTLAALPAPGRLLYTSSTGVYGDCGGRWVTEADRPEPTDDSGRICLEAEQLLQDGGWPFAWSILRLAGLYGPGRMLGAESVRAGQPVAAEPDTHLNLIHVADAAAAVLAAATHAEPAATYNISDGQPVTRREFYQEVARLLAAPPPTFDPTAARRHRGDRKVANERMRADLGVCLKFPDYRAGLRDALLAAPNSH